MSVNLKTLYLVFLSALALVSCNDNWVFSPQLHGYLKLHTKSADWLTARVTCHNEGAVLASPWTAGFTTAVHKLQWPKKHSLPLLFSGVLVTFPEEAYYKGGRLPDAFIGVQRCGVFLAGGTTGEIDCKLKLPFICYAPTHALAPEFSATPKLVTTTTSEYTTTLKLVTALKPKSTITSTSTTTPTSTTSPTSTLTTTTTTPAPESITKLTPAPSDGTPDCGYPEYKFFNQTGHCYKFHTFPRRWTIASSICNGEGGNLTVINSDVEARHLVSLFGRHPASSLDKAIFKFDRDFVLVGIFWDSYHWLTIDGFTLEEAGYAKWYNEGPYDVSTYNVGAIYRDGTFNNVNNEAQFVFICEKVPSK